MHTGDGIRPVEHEIRNVRFSGFLHTVRHRGNVSVKSRANILNIEHQRVNAAQHFRCWAMAFVREEAPNFDARLRIDSIADVFPVLFPGETVLRGIKRRHMNTRCQHAVHIAAAVAIDSRMIGDESHALALKRPEAVIGPDMSPVLTWPLRATSR